MNKELTDIDRVVATAEAYDRTKDQLLTERLILAAWPAVTQADRVGRSVQEARIVALERIVDGFEKQLTA